MKVMHNEFGVDEIYEAFVADVHPKFKKTGCSSQEALHAQRQNCPVLIKYAPPLGEGNSHECPWCGGKVYPVSKVEKCELCGMPYSTEGERL